MQRCTVCCHPNKKAVDAELLRGSPTLREIALRTGLSKTALLRHRDRGHISVAMAKAQEAAQLSDASELLSRLAKVCADCERLQGQAEAAGDIRAALQAVTVLGTQLQALMRVGLEVERQRSGLQRQAEATVRGMSDEELATSILTLLPRRALPPAKGNAI